MLRVATHFGLFDLQSVCQVAIFRKLSKGFEPLDS